ncbi:MAG TPA: NAD-binding protein, partial [Gammaproteobacteria bacterium]|nr:NAD-binding protein [Gammaproteobacteria bacterium]
MNFIVVGCGRVGAELAYHLFSGGHQVVVVDSRKESFNRLHPDFRGRTLEGEGLA